jgi:large repetitive protein
MRVFDVFVEGILVANDLDVVEAAGEMNTAFVVSVPVSVVDGAITIELEAVRENPFISAIEVIRLPNNSPVAILPEPPMASPTQFQTILINCGGMQFIFF